MICIWKRERRERDRQRDKETGRCLILPALFSGMRLRRLGVCRRSRRASSCTDSSLHAGSLLFTKKKKQHSSFIGCSLSADFGITVRSQDSESIPMRIIFTSCFHLGSTVHRCGRSPEFQVSRISLFSQVISELLDIVG